MGHTSFWVHILLIAFIFTFAGPARADDKLIDHLKRPKSGFRCEAFENGNLCSTNGAPGFSGRVSFYVGNEVTRPDKIAVQFHGLRGKWSNDGSAAKMIRGFDYASAIQESGPNSILVFPFDTSSGVSNLIDLAEDFSPFLKWVKSSTKAKDPKIMVAGHSAGINALEALAENKEVMKQISGLAAFDPVYLKKTSFEEDIWKEAMQANPKLKIFCSYRPGTKHSKNVCNSLKRLGAVANETETEDHWEAVNESISTALRTTTGDRPQTATRPDGRK